MTATGWAEVAGALALLLLCVRPLGEHIADVHEGRRPRATAWLLPLENACYRWAGVDRALEMSWKSYALALLAFNALGFGLLFALQRAQGWLPFNPEHAAGVPPGLAFDTAVSFVTNTNWQAYAGETTMSSLTQMMGLTVQNFLSAATGIAALAALVRGFARHATGTVGNFWADLVRTTLHLLLPLSLVFAVVLVSQGVVQSFAGPRSVTTIESGAAQVLPSGPVASLLAIKQLGTNGGGYFNANSAHPFENPTPLSGLLEWLAILLIPAALTHTFGRMVGDVRQGVAVLGVMTLLFVGLTIPLVLLEQQPDARLRALGVDAQANARQAGGAMEGKELRFGPTGSALWAAATTAASNGSVNSMHDSFSPLGGMIPMVFILLGEVVFGGVGSGLYGMLVFVLVAVFMAGLMVGRTPEYLGKRVEAFEVKMAALVVLIPPALVLLGLAFAVMIPVGAASIANPGPHGFSELLYAFASAANNNGSAFAGLSADRPFFHAALGFCMAIGRFGVLLPVLAMAGAFSEKKRVPAGNGTLPTHTPLFAALVVAVVLIVGALTFVPALALGPIAEHLLLVGGAR